MPIRRVALIFAVLALLPWGALYGPSSATAGEAPSSATPAANTASVRALLEQGKAEDAWPLLLDLLREEPTSVEINTLMVRTALSTGRTNQAIAALERLVALRPKDASLRMELAKAYAHAGDEASAKAEVEQVRRLDRTLGETELEKSLSRATLAGRASRELWQFSGSLSAGFVWDSNVNGGLDSLRLGGGSWNLVLDKGSRKASAMGEYLSGTVSVGRRLGASSPWWLVGDAAFYGKFYNSTVPSNQYFGLGRIALGLRRTGAENLFDLRLNAEQSNYDPYDRMRSVGAELTFLHALTPSLHLMTKAGLDSRQYVTSTSRNGTYWHVGEYLRVLWGGENSVLIGARFLGGEAKERRSSYTGWEAMLRFSFSPLPRLGVSPFIAWREQRYRDIPTWISLLLKEGKRHDRSLLTGVFFTWRWTDHLSSEAGWQYTRNYSNSTFYKYDQHQINVGLTYKF